MSKKLTISIGIPAFNEEQNIPKLLDNVLSQSQSGCTIKEILVVSDASTDGTNEIVAKYSDKRIRLFVNKKRVGQQQCQNLLIENYQCDILVILEADILLQDKFVIENLIKPFYESGNANLGMTVGTAYAVLPSSFVERISVTGYCLKSQIFNNWKNGMNVYGCGGHSMKAMSRKFTSRLRWPKSVPEDAYTYFKLLELNLTMQKVPNAKTWMRCPANFFDRLKQGKKFRSGKSVLLDYFEKKVIENEYRVPRMLALKYIIHSTVSSPIFTIFYFLESTLIFLLTKNEKIFNPLYDIYTSTKKITI